MLVRWDYRDSETEIMTSECINSPSNTQAIRSYKTLEARIVSGELAPGQELSERSISEQLSVGRTPVKEALQKLANNHLVLIEPRRGTFVAPLDMGSTEDLFFVARPLKQLLVRLACERASNEERDLFRGLILRLRTAADRPGFIPLYSMADDLLSKAARNAYLVAVLDPMSMMIHRIRIACGLAGDKAVAKAFAEVIEGIVERDQNDTILAYEKYADLFASTIFSLLQESAEGKA
jgi:DNA-binding GntR family transcriptional regulator